MIAKIAARLNERYYNKKNGLNFSQFIALSLAYNFNITKMLKKENEKRGEKGNKIKKRKCKKKIK